ncbi:glycosyltransferase family 4 protein [Lacinutrix sp. MedPE-SW]|uniref:glycosyltransferase family 4 protein n=1 Tax=Lacinutrix sp. MedPE-SW TaxID=1860087 RepID=UPI000914E515|nr:glycosyltransferase family 4 protein [Lacinutrix sp. MedPE-SW]OIQ23504.1 MAG: hypothetical protein BM549_02765 [Lacinutrix sp. MedPE-SW]
MSKKILFITQKLKHYRVPILNLISSNENIDLTVAHSGKKTIQKNINFKELIIPQKKIGPFYLQGDNFVKLCNSFDVVVVMCYLQNISYMQLQFLKNRKFKLIYWGIGVKASQNSKFDSPTILNYFRYFIARKADAMIFYSDYAKNKHVARKINPNKLFVMQNTIEVQEQINTEVDKNCILFVGTLNKSKKIFLLFEAYKEALILYKDLPLLKIVGDGEDYLEAKKWVVDNNLENKIILYGAIYEQIELEKLFKSALATISPGQAGLSVLSSFAYGAPFITSSNAITGGERLNIKNNYNGLLFENDNELKEILIDIHNNPEKYIELGKNAKEFYLKYRTPENMANSFIDAVKYVIQKQ